MREHLGRLREMLPSSLRRYIVEIALITVAGALAGSTILASAFSSSTSVSDNIVVNDARKPSPHIIVDIEGAVQKPGIYTLNEGSRLNDLLEKAQGFSEHADLIFFYKHFNRAEIIKDQQKFYVPSTEEISSGEFNFHTAPTTKKVNSTSVDLIQSSSVIGINSATESELDTLHGIGPVTAQKIIDNRPYESLEQLLEKKILKSNIYDQIKDQLTLD